MESPLMVALRRIFLLWANFFLKPPPKIGSADLGFSVMQWELISKDDVSPVPISPPRRERDFL